MIDTTLFSCWYFQLASILTAVIIILLWIKSKATKEYNLGKEIIDKDAHIQLNGIFKIIDRQTAQDSNEQLTVYINCFKAWLELEGNEDISKAFYRHIEEESKKNQAAFGAQHLTNVKNSDLDSVI